MADKKDFDVIVIGGSYSGLSAAMALGRALRQVLIIDSEMPCNWQTPHSHNFLTQDGKTPKEIATIARDQVKKYETIQFYSGLVTYANSADNGFEVQTKSGKMFIGKKLIFATGIRDIMPNINGYAECWGISVLHCPYCHGYEVRNEITGILGNDDYGFEFSTLISNWTKDLTLYTNGSSRLTPAQTEKLKKNKIKIVTKEIERLDHIYGHVQNVIFKDGTTAPITALYARNPFEQQCLLPKVIGCELSGEGYIQVDAFQKTTVPGIFACGDNTSRIRTVANAVAMGTTAGMMVNREITFEEF